MDRAHNRNYEPCLGSKRSSTDYLSALLHPNLIKICRPPSRPHELVVLASLEYICSMPLTIQLHPSENQTAFNLKRWRQLLADPELARLPYRVETDRHGHILMSPPPAPAHGKKQNRIGTLLEQLLPNGHVVTECPVSTPDGVKAIDVAWLAPERGQEADTETCLTRAPEICVEILSPHSEVDRGWAFTKQIPPPFIRGTTTPFSTALWRILFLHDRQIVQNDVFNDVDPREPVSGETQPNRSVRPGSSKYVRSRLRGPSGGS